MDRAIKRIQQAKAKSISVDDRLVKLEEKVSMLESNPVWKNSEKRKQESIDEIAKRVLGIDTLGTRGDVLDLYELPVWWIKQALQEAFDAGLSHRILPEDDR